MNTPTPVALITGSAQRIGAVMGWHLHAAGYRILIHYRHSESAAQQLATQLNAVRDDSARLLQADLNACDYEQLAQTALAQWGRLDLLVNNASSFYPTPVGETTAAQWDDLMGSNLKAPYFLSQALTPALHQSKGCIINLIDIHADRPLSQYPVYCAAKAGLAMLTQSLAKELGPHIRVNGIAPGAILWPEQDDGNNAAHHQAILAHTALQRRGEPEDIARTVLFLAQQAPYITGQIIRVDGGRSL